MTAAQGMSGVGKTCAITAVGNDSDVKECYFGGVYFLSFGQGATDGDVISKVANKVEESGGHLLAEKIRNENNLSSAIEKGQSWFSGHKCLFICDDMWRCKGRDTEYLHSMRRLCSEEDGGCVLLSTRDLQVSNEVGSSSLVRFEERDDVAAVEILCRYAEVRKEWVQSGSERVRDAMNKVVKRCGGLPVALGVAGNGIRSIARETDENRAGEKDARLDAIVTCGKKLERSLYTQIDLGKRKHGVHRGLYASLNISLKFASRTNKDEFEGRECFFERLHRGLCVR